MKLELSIHALNLKNTAGMTQKSDPFAVVTTLATTPGAKPKPIGKTETILNTLHPKWVTVFQLDDYSLGVPMKVAINIFDASTGNKRTNTGHKSMGSAVFDIAEVLGARGNTKAKKLQSGGTLFANIRKSTGSGIVKFQMKGNKLTNVEGMFSKSDSFFELSRKVDNAGGLTWDNVYRSKEIQNSLNPEWELVTVDLSALCGGDLDAPVLIEVFDYEKTGKHKLMGKVEISVSGIKKSMSTSTPVQILKTNKPAGTLIFTRCDIEGHTTAAATVPPPATTTPSSITTEMSNVSLSTVQPLPPPVAPSAPYGSRSNMYNTPPVNNVAGPDFVDYVSGGCELNVVVAIDFTGSNGDPRIPGTLHHVSSTERNDYQKAIAAIVSALAKYDSDQKFPVLGFGAKYSGVVRNCFQCGTTEEVHGIEGILNAYSQVFQSGLIMSSPTNFDEVIEAAAQRAKTSYQQSQQTKGQQSYTILLIVTDGAVSDPQRTVQALDRSTDAPLSVVIVGVGNADFSSMRFLDDYNKNNTSFGNNAKRDIVQFVEFNKHKNNSVSLTSETLDEIPAQLSSYFQSKGISPLPPISRSDSTLSMNAVEEPEVDLSLDVRENEIVVVSGGNYHDDGFASEFSRR